MLDHRTIVEGTMPSNVNNTHHDAGSSHVTLHGANLADDWTVSWTDDAE